MKSLKEYINESIKDSGSYKKPQFDKDVSAYDSFLKNKSKISKFLEEQGIDDEDDDLMNVLKEFTSYMASSENMAIDDEDEEYSYKDIVERAPEWLENNIVDEYDIDEDSLSWYVGIAVSLWNKISKCKINY